MRIHLHLFIQRLLLIGALWLGISTLSSATHYTGFVIEYDCIGPNQYLVTLNVYRDCNGVSVGSSQVVNYSSATCGVSSSLTLTSQSVTDITPLCPSQASACGGNGPIGVELHVFQGTLTLPSGCNDWVLSSTSCCRNNAITNLSGPGGNSIYVQTTLDNTVSPCNSSPSFTNNPQLFACVGQTVNYQQLASDPDGDSLVYSMTNCLQGAGSSVSYAGGFSGTNPLTVPITINPQTGEIQFTANQPQVAVLCVLIEEFRNGVLISTIIRDIQFNITNCNNTIPDVTGINGSATVFDTTVCEGGLICFDVDAGDVDAGQNITMTYSNNIPGATFTQTGSGASATGTFCWNTSIGDQGTYVFIITAEDDACPILGQNTQAFTVIVGPNPNPPVDAGPDVQICEGDTATLNATTTAPGGLISSFAWTPTANLTSPNTASTGAHPSATTSYTVALTYTDGCVAMDAVSVMVADDPTASIFPATAEVCGGAGFVLTGTTDQAGMGFQWFDPALTPLGTGTISGTSSSIPVSVPTAAGTYAYILEVTNPGTGCISRDTAFLVVGTPPALPSCVNIYVSTTGAAANPGTQASPTTLAEALSRAACNNAVIKVATGTYNIDNALTIGSFVTLEGGFDQASAWTKSSTPGASTINRTVANPEGAVNAQRLVAFYGNGATGFRFQDLTITTANANQPGMSTYGMHMTGCTDYDIVRTQINPGNAATGRTGNAGTAGTNGSAGINGQNGDNDDENRNGGGGRGGAGAGGTAFGNGGAGGTTGANVGQNGTVGAGINGGGGAGGGSGGGEDRDGARGGNGGGGLGAFGGGGQESGCNGSLNCGSNESGRDAQDGANGTNGTVGTVGPVGSHVGGFWVPGGSGGTGTNGTGGAGGGGGGGGAGEGGFFCLDGKGSGGGGGGGGGRAGTGGTGGRGGGSSYSIYLFLNGANGNFTQANLNAGAAGAAGPGGNGGNGGNGGAHGNGSTYHGNEVGCGGDGGDGGDGGNGGNGGNGRAGENNNMFQSGGTAPATSNISFNLAAQPVITAENINCTDVTVDFTNPASVTWDFTTDATPQSPTGANVNTIFDVINRYDIVAGANTYAGFHNVSFENTIVPNILSSATVVGPDTFTVCEGSFATFESQFFADNYVWNFNGAIPNPGSMQTVNSQFNTPGFYPITLSIITDCCGLSPEDTVYLYVTPLPNVTGSGNVSICDGESTTLTVTGLAATDSIVWTPTTDMISMLPSMVVVNPSTTTTYTATVYSVTPTPGATIVACPVVLDFVVTVNPTPLVNFASVDPTCNGNGSATATITNPTGLYNFNWSNAFNTAGAVTSTNAGLSVGAYYVTVTETVTGCTNVDSVSLFPGIGAPNVFVQTTSPATCGNSNGSVTVSTNGGAAPLTYNWADIGVAPPTRAGLPGGVYSVTVTDNVGCTSSVTFDITQQPALAINFVDSTNPACIASSGSIEVEATGGTPFVTYLWSNNATTPLITGLGAGTYTITATDANGCTATETFVLSSITPTINMVANGVLLCPNDTTGITVNANVGTQPFVYNWSGGNSATFPPNIDAVTGVTAGSYSVTVTDATGTCSITDAVTIAAPPAFSIALDSTDIDCFGNANGTATVTSAGGNAPIGFVWNAGAQTTPTITGLAPGTYIVTATDASGCTLVDSTVVNQPAAPLAPTMTDSNNVSCFWWF